MSRAGRLRFGRRIGGLLQGLGKRRRDITRENLRQAFPDKSEEWVRRIARASYDNLGITLAEIMAFPRYRSSNIGEFIRFHNLDLIEENAAKGQGVILLSAHYGNWEILAYALPYITAVPVSVIVKNQRNRFTNTMLHELRGGSGNRLLPMNAAARAIVSGLRKGEAVALLADQSAQPQSDVFLPFFHRPAAVYKAPAAMALRYGAPVVMGFAVRNPDGSYDVDLQQIPTSDLSNTPEGILELTRRHTAHLEEQIRRRPELWVWQHRRWKHKMPSQAELHP